MTWTDEDVLGAVAAALLPELRGRTHEVLRWVERPGELRRTDIAVPLGLQARLREASLWQRAERCLRDSARRGYRVIPIADPTYPPLLKATESPPIVLWVQGRWPLPETPLLAVVGSRRATVYGKNAVRFLLEPLVGAGVGVVSGMAVGVDAAAHQLCIEREATRPPSWATGSTSRTPGNTGPCGSGSFRPAGRSSASIRPTHRPGRSCSLSGIGSSAA